MATATIRDNTTKQATIDYLRKRLALFGNKTIRRNYANISGALEDVPIGTVMGIVGSTGKYVICKSGATDGSQVPVGIMFEELEDIAIAGTQDDVLILNGGQINKGLLLFDGTDTLTTMVTALGGDKKSMQDWLINNGVGVELISVTDPSEYDV